MSRPIRTGVGFLILAFAGVLPLHSQTSASDSQRAEIRGQVMDPSGAAMAEVTVHVLKDNIAVIDSKTDAKGRFAVQMAFGNYQLEISAPPFKPYARSIAVFSRELSVPIKLALEGIPVEVNVAAEKTPFGVNPDWSLTARVIRGEDLLDLPVDADTLLEYLQALAGANAQLVVDGFPGGAMPSRDQIAQIVIDENLFNADGMGPSIRVQSRDPGLTRWTGSLGLDSQESMLSGRSPGSDTRPAQHSRTFSASFDGPLIPSRWSTGIDISIPQNEAGTATIHAVTLDGPVNKTMTQPSKGWNVGVRQHWTLSDSHNIDYRFNWSSSRNLGSGAGGLYLEERRSNTSSSFWNMQLSDRQTLSPAFINEFRFQANRTHTAVTPVTNSVSINVPGAFFGGGSGNRAASDRRAYYLGDTANWNPNARWSTRITLDANYQTVRDRSEYNYQGTFLFSSLADYRSGHPIQFTQNSGNPLLHVEQLDLKASFQADYRINSKAGVRVGANYAIQSHLRDYNNIGPLAQFLYKVGSRSVISLGAAISYPPVGIGIGDREQLLGLDGTERVQTTIENPSFPDPLESSSSRVEAASFDTAIRVQSPDFVSAYTERLQLGVTQGFYKNWKLSTNFSILRSIHEMQKLNINAPVSETATLPLLTAAEYDQLRPLFPIVTDIIQYDSTGNSITKGFNLLLQLPSTKKLLGTSLSGSAGYDLTWSDDDLDFTNSYKVRADWAANDQRHRFVAQFAAHHSRLGALSLLMTANSGRSYSVTTGTDDNRDGSYNDRPAGVARNSLRGPGSYNVNLIYSTPSYRAIPFQLTIQVFNLLNHTEAYTYGSVAGSPLFGLPASFGPSRSIRISTSIASF